MHVLCLPGLIASRSADTLLPGIDRLAVILKQRIESGLQAVTALERMGCDKSDVAAWEQSNAHKADLGCGPHLFPHGRESSLWSAFPQQRMCQWASSRAASIKVKDD